MARQIRKQIRKTKTASLVSLLGILALLVFSATPAFAHHKADHSQGGGNANSASDHDGDADSDSNTAYTEDNDTNDGNTPNNVEDDGDNAHPSGKDRSVENGGSGNQGKSESNPDDSKGPMRYEGAQGDDKPNGPGGTDLADQDGNNGCGNDDDFDDDNNGWCGKKKSKPEAPVTVAPTAEVKDDEVKADDEVKGRIDFAKPKTNVPTDVLNKVIRNAAPVVRTARTTAAPGAVLPFTGGSVSYLAAAALGLIALGTLVLRLKTATDK